MVSYVSPTSAPARRPLVFRLRLSSGPAVAGVIGKAKFQYDVWGDTVNTASRMESHGVPGKIQLSGSTYDLVKDDFVCEPRGVVDVKCKGPMETWFLVGAC
jgi:adenylate cyclase